MRWKRAWYKYIAILFATIGAVYYLLGSYQLWLETSPWDFKTELISPSLAAADEKGNLYIVDDGMMRVMKVDAKRQVQWVRYGSERDQDQLYRCKVLTVDGAGNIYLVNQIYGAENDRRVVRESIVKFDSSGEFLNTLVQYDYSGLDTQPELYGWINSLRVIDGKLYYTYKQENSIGLYEIIADGPELKKQFPLAQARTAILGSRVSYDGQSLYYVTKKGQILREDGKGPVLCYQGWGSNDKQDSASLIGDFSLDAENRLVFVDNEDCSIKEIRPEALTTSIRLPSVGNLRSDFEKDALYGTVRLTKDGKILTVISGSNIVFVKDGEEPQIFADFYNAPLQQIRCLLVGLSILWLIMVAFGSGWMLWHKAWQAGRATQIFLGMLCLLVTAVSVGSYFWLQERNGFLTTQVENQIYSLLKASERDVDRGALERFRHYSDYGNPDMKVLQENLEQIRDLADKNKELYFLILYKTDGKNCYQVLDRIDSVAPIWPAGSYEGSVFQQAAEQKKVIMRPRNVSSIGIWSEGITALYNDDGSLAGFIEIGVNTQMMHERQSRLVVRVGLLVLFITVLLLGIFVYMLQSHLRELMQISAAKQAIETELSVGKKIQMMFLPHPFAAKETAGFAVEASIEPAKMVGGDFYDFYKLDEKHVCVTMADVSGKGVPAALFMVVARTILRNLVRSMCPVDDLAAVMRCANMQLAESNDEMMFVTVFLGILEVDTGRFLYVNAGHSAPIICSADNEIHLLTGKKNAIVGAMPGLDYQQQEILLEPGSWMFLYTDGVTEAMDVNGQLYGEERLQACLAAQEAEYSPLQRLESVRESLRTYVGEAPQSDDITMMVLQRTGK